jgi:sugar-specific transcriptional regulator TrmB
MVVNKGMEVVISRLMHLGLSEYEAKAYIGLLRENPASAYEIAKNSGIPTSKIYEVIRRLEARGMIQTIRGEEQKRLFMPVSPQDFVRDYRTMVEENLEAIEAELQGIETTIDTSYIWHIGDYDALMLRAKRMIDTAERTLEMILWPEEMRRLRPDINDAERRGVKIAIVHYGPTSLRIGQIYRHPPDETIYAQKGVKGLFLVADSKEALACRIGKEAHAMWSMDECFVMMVEDYIRHDIYFMKVVERFDHLLRERFGDGYERLCDIYSDEG